MEKIQILAIGRDPVLLQKLSSFLNENPRWESTATVDNETAIQIFHQRKFDIVLLIDEIEIESFKKLKAIFTFNYPDIIIIRHEGDSTGFLANEIQENLEKSKRPINIIDDALKVAKSKS